MLIILLLLLLFRTGIDHIHGWAVHDNSSDMLDLLDFKKAITSDPHGALSSWNTTTPFCQWNGVLCPWKHPGRVITLELAGHGLSGPVSSSLGCSGNSTSHRTLSLARCLL
uniref:Leucine-rich repeat-containing N-terminal plant-type domain-containing protein n=1 Tax=Arundo donax TaxID=35708 RepID=A0A0A9GBZ6_ARUDO